MAVLVIGIIAALLIGASVGVALCIEVRALRVVLLHAKKTQQRIGLVEGERYRASSRSAGERAGKRATYEDRISDFASVALDELASIRALLGATSAAPERAESSGEEEDRRYRDKGPARVAEAADAIKRRRAKQRGLAACEVPAAIGNDAAEEEDDDKTSVWTSPNAARMRVEAEAGGVTRRPSATPREALSVAVAPPASAPPPTSPEPAILAAGLGRPRSARSAPLASPTRARSETLMGMPSVLLAPDASDASERTSWPALKPGGGVGLSTRPPPGIAPDVAIPRFPPTLVSMQAQSAPPASASRAVPVISTKEVCKRCDRSGVIRELGGAIVPCPNCGGSSLVDTSTRFMTEAS